MKKVRPLCYHRVSDDYNDFNNTNVSINNFESHMRWIVNNYEVIAAESIYTYIEGGDRDAIIVTFDDGYRDVIENALPILEEYQIPATIFLTSGMVDNKNGSWMDRLIQAALEPHIYHDWFEIDDDLIKCRWYTRTNSERLGMYMGLSQIFRHIHSDRRQSYISALCAWAGIDSFANKTKETLTADDIKKLSEHPLITIGAHTVNHSSLKWISNEEQKREIFNSKNDIEKMIGKEIDLFAYPWGSDDDFTQQAIELIKKAGFTMAFSTRNDEITNKSDRYSIPRWCVKNYSEKAFSFFITELVFGLRSSKDIMYARDVNKICYVGKLEFDDILLNGKQKIVIWGSGYWGRKLKIALKVYNIADRLITYGDNDTSMVGGEVDCVPIESKETIKKIQQNTNCLLLVKGSYAWEIAFDLMENGMKNIHILL